MLHEQFVEEIRSTITPNRVVIARITDTLTQKHDKPHAYGTCVIGRSPTCELVLTDPACSRLHCIIYFNNGHLTIRDLDSRVGTIVNGEELANFRDFPLSKSDTIAVAGERFIIVDVDEKEVKEPLPASAVLTETAIECPFCGGEAYSFSEALNQLEAYVKEVVDEDESLEREILDERDKMSVIESELERIYKLHSEHYSNVLRGEEKIKEDAAKQEAEREEEKEQEEEEAEELRMSELSQEESVKESLKNTNESPKGKKVTINENNEIIERKSMFKSFMSLFKSKKAEEPEAKSVKEHKPTPFVKGGDYEEEESHENEEEKQEVNEGEEQEESKEASQEMKQSLEEPKEHEELVPEHEEEIKEESKDDEEEDFEKEEEPEANNLEEPPSYHFEGENEEKKDDQ